MATKSDRLKMTPKMRHEEFAAKIIAMLEKGQTPWQKPWKAGELHPPFNPVSGTIYSGLNRVMLSEPDYADPRWMTFKHAQSQNYRVKKGSKSQPIVYWQWTESVDKLDGNGRPVLDSSGEPEKEIMLLERPRVRFYSVFHASQLETENGQPIPPFEPKELEWHPHERAEAILEASGASIFHDQRDRGFYSLQKDEIHLPPKENFANEGDYYPIAFHELGHWTRHPSRLNRENGPYGSELYAREELRAHIASWMMSQDLGIAFKPDEHHASYVQDWVKVLKDDPYEIMRACRDAERINQYVMGLDQQREQAAEITFSELENDGGDKPPAVDAEATPAGSAAVEVTPDDTAYLSQTIEQITRLNAAAYEVEDTRSALAATQNLLITAVSSPAYNAPGTEVESAIIKSLHYRCSLHNVAAEPNWLLNALNYSIVALGNIQANRLNLDDRKANLAKLADYNKNMEPQEMGLASGEFTDFKRDLDGQEKDWCWDRESGTVLCREKADQPWRPLDHAEGSQLRAYDHQADLVPVVRLGDGQVMTYDGQLHGPSLVLESRKDIGTEVITRYLENAADRLASATNDPAISKPEYRNLLQEIGRAGRNLMSRPAYSSVDGTKDAAMLKCVVNNLHVLVEPELAKRVLDTDLPFRANHVLMIGHLSAKLRSDHVTAAKFQNAIEANIRERFVDHPEQAEALIPSLTGRKVQFDHGLSSGRQWCWNLHGGRAMYKDHEHDLWKNDPYTVKQREDFPSGDVLQPFAPIVVVDHKSFLTLDGNLYSTDQDNQAVLDEKERQADIFHRTNYVNDVLAGLVRPNLVLHRDNIFKAMLATVEDVRRADFNKGDEKFNAFLDTVEKIGQREFAASALDAGSDLTLAQIENRVTNSVLEVIATARELDYRGLDYVANESPGPKYRVVPLLPAHEGEKVADLQYRGQALRVLRESLAGEMPRVFAVAQQSGNAVIAGFEDRINADGFAQALNGREITFIKIPVPRYSEEKVMLDVPFKEKEAAKALGATWDKEVKKWCARPGTDLTPLSQWITQEPEQEQKTAKWYHDLNRPDDHEYLYGDMAELVTGNDPEKIEQLKSVYNNFVRLISESVTDELGPDRILERSRSRLTDQLLETQMLHGKMIELKLLPPDARFPHQELAEGILEGEKGRDSSTVADDRPPMPELTKEVVYLNVPYKERREAKEAGAKWNAQKKLWYAPVGVDLNKLAQFLPENEPAPAPAVSPVEEFRQRLEANGFVLKGDPFMDGRIHRAPIEGKPGQLDGAYQAYADGVPNGWFENHRDGDGKVTKWVYSGQQLTPAQKAAMQAQIERRREQLKNELDFQYTQASERVYQKFVESADRPVDHANPYLQSKGVGNYELRQDQDGNLLVFGLNLELCDFPEKDDVHILRHFQTVQTISPDGQKRFEAGSQKNGAVHLIGTKQFNKIATEQANEIPSLFSDLIEQPEILVVEGYATGASLHEATGLPVAVAFDAGNLKPVAEALRRKFPKANLTVCADNDYPLVHKKIRQEHGDGPVTPELEEKYANHNKGVVKAMEAAKAVNAEVLIPQFSAEEKSKGLTDFNDLAQSRGTFAVTKLVSPKHRSQTATVDLRHQADNPAQGCGLAM